MREYLFFSIGCILVLKRDHVAAIGNIAGLELDAGCRRLERGAPGVANARVGAENR